MCGLTGFLGGRWATGATAGDGAKADLLRMSASIAHRGPDSDGHWLDVDAGIALGHRRLAIVDLSPAGAQPMRSADGRYVMAFNGEIYNHQTLRAELEKRSEAGVTFAEDLPDTANGVRWRGHSDTETLLAAMCAWGIRGAIERCIGMFAFAVWDRQLRTLTLGRDRMGEKPLYYGWQGQGSDAVLIFGSELKSLKAHPAFSAAVDRDALHLLMRHGYIPAPYSIYQDIRKLPAASLLTVKPGQRDAAPMAYWSLANAARAGDATPFTGTPTEAVDALETLLQSAVSQQMMADVPLGAFLSGGVDSSTVVALMQAQSSRPIKTFTIGFDEAAYDEATHARAVAAHLGTDHTELYVTPQQALDVIPRLPSLYCEPFADISQIPTFLVSQLARQHVTVSLSGDAGDELFCGYDRYARAARFWRWISPIPTGIRRAAARGITIIPPQGWNSLLRPLHRAMPSSLRQHHPGDKVHKLANLLPADSIDALSLGLTSHWGDSARLVLGGSNHPPPTDASALSAISGLGSIQRMMALDAMTFLPDDILVKLDRAAMGVSLESRIPLLDHRVVEFAWRLPQSLKRRDGLSKWALRQVLYRHVPKALIERPKMGFSAPLHSWLRGSLRPWADDLLSESRLRQDGYFNPAAVRQKWAQHVSGQRNWTNHLWDVLMFQQWLHFHDNP
jgi:asparagine synthase (glutamine-hydrolysing)